MAISEFKGVERGKRQFIVLPEDAKGVEIFLKLLKHDGWIETRKSEAAALAVTYSAPFKSLAEEILSLTHRPKFLALVGAGKLTNRWCARAMADAAAHNYECIRFDQRQMIFSRIDEKQDELTRDTINSFMHGLDALIWRSPNTGDFGSRLQQLRQKRSLEKLNKILAKGTVRVVVDDTADLSQNKHGISVKQIDIETLHTDGLSSLEPWDILLASSRYFVTRPELMEEIKKINEDDSDLRVTCAFLRDNHHMYSKNLEIASVVDFVALGHAYKTHYLRAENFNLFFPGAMGVIHFKKKTVEKIWGENKEKPRSNRLYGSYNVHTPFKDRTEFIELCSSLEDSDVIQWWPDTNITKYKDLSPAEKFNQWMAYKVSLVVNTDFCVPIRVYDALLSGQIPIVPASLVGMQEIFSRGAFRELPIVTYEENTSSAVQRAWADGIEMFDRGGLEAAERRHNFAMENLFVGSTWDRIFDLVAEFSRR